MSKIPDLQLISEVEVENQRVLLRTDLDASLDRSGHIVDDSRIRAALPVIQALLEAGARVIVASRFGEYKTGVGTGVEGEAAPSIEPAAARLSELSGLDVLLPDGCTGDSVKRVITGLREGQICVLENLCLEGETGPGREALARQLLEYADLYVGDSLRALSLESATTSILPRLLPIRAAGPALAAELAAIQRLRSQEPGRRLIIWGGTSLSARLPLLGRLDVDQNSRVFLVGVPANTLLAARGGSLGRSTIEEPYLAGARTLAERLGDRLLLPTDFVTAESARSDAPLVTPSAELAPHLLALDIGPESLARLEAEIAQAESVVWCGVPGLYREETFARGTRAIAELLAKTEAFTAVIGDDTVTAARSVAPEATLGFDYLASGGQAALDLLEGSKLPGLSALRGSGT